MAPGVVYIASTVRRTAFAVALALAIPCPPAGAQEAVYLVRHAERADQTADSPLSAEGEARAALLARVLKDAGITHVFTTDLKRTVQTAAPAAAAFRLTPRPLPAGDVDALVSALRALGPKDRALVVGHSNTLPVILFALGAGTLTIADAEYDNLFVVVPHAGAAPVLLRMRY